MKKIRLSPTAQQNLCDVLAKSRRDFGDDAMVRMKKRMQQAFDQIAEFPESGHHRIEFAGPPVRFLLVTPYLIAYDPSGAEVEILLLCHGARDTTDLL